MDVSVREAVPGDAHRICDLHLASIRGLAGQSYNEDQVAAWAHDRDPDDYPIGSSDTYFVVAEDKTAVIGFGWLNLAPGEYFQTEIEGEITAIYVHPSVTDHGIGSRIYTTLETRAIQQNIASLGLWSSLNAVPFYEAQGFERVAEHSHEYQDGVELTLVEMSKQSLQ
jgi:putative acetyltransferase